MKAKLKVLVPFTDKNDRTVRYKEGDTVSFDDIERVNDLVARKVCRLEAFEAEKPETAAANEIAVEAFLNEQIRFTDIPAVISRSIEKCSFIKDPDLNAILDTDKSTREFASNLIARR